MILLTPRLELVLESTESVLARIDALPAAERQQVSLDWIEQLRASAPSPWTHGFAIRERATGTAVGSCAFKGPPGPDGSVEIAYVIDSPHRGHGYAKEAADRLTTFAFESADVAIVRAHTLPEVGASTGVLTACGFHRLGIVEDPDDGPVWRWERVHDVKNEGSAHVDAT